LSLPVVLVRISADVGGILGLFLGCSLLTIFEFIDCIFMLFMATCKSGNQAKLETEQQQREEMKEDFREGKHNEAMEEKQV
jgi:uncharacterized membrane protein